MSRALAALGAFVYVAGSCLWAYLYPQSVLGFLGFETSLLVLYLVPAPRVVKHFLGGAALLVLVPLLGSANAYYLEIGIQIGIFVALALGLNIVVGFCGLLNLGFVAFYAIGAYFWAVFGSPQANEFIPGNFFPLSPNWFFPFLLLSIALGALTGLLLGLPVLRLRGDYLAIVTLGFAEVVRALVNNLDKPINLTNGPRGIAPIVKPPLFFQPWLEFFGVQVAEAQLYPFYFYFLVLLFVFAVVLVTRRLEDSRIGRAWKAIREDEIAASAMGIPVVRMKLFGFAAGVTILNLQLLKGLSLWLNGLRQSGAALTLPLLGSFPLSQLPVQFEPAKYERMVFGLILILMMIFRPQGVLPPRRERNP